MSRITDALREARIAAKVRQADLAKILGITQGFLSDIERGRRELPEQHYGKLPPPIRAAVIKAAKAVHREGIKRLDHIGKEPHDG